MAWIEHSARVRKWNLKSHEKASRSSEARDPPSDNKKRLSLETEDEGLAEMALALDRALTECSTSWAVVATPFVQSSLKVLTVQAKKFLLSLYFMY